MAVIVVPGSTAGALAAKAATKTIPTVFMLGVDPVEFRLVASLAHPGGNMTGVAQLMTPAMAKRLDLLRQLVPTSVTFGLLTNPANPFSQAESGVAASTARTLGLVLHIVDAERQDDIDASIEEAHCPGCPRDCGWRGSHDLYRVGVIAGLASLACYSDYSSMARRPRRPAA